MAKQVIEFDGNVTETLPGGKFRVHLKDQDRGVIAVLSGKMRMHNIKIVNGDQVKVEFSPYDLSTGRISFRYSGSQKPVPQETVYEDSPDKEEQ